jgi:hypothetical protein
VEGDAPRGRGGRGGQGQASRDSRRRMKGSSGNSASSQNSGECLPDPIRGDGIPKAPVDTHGEG